MCTILKHIKRELLCREQLLILVDKKNPKRLSDTYLTSFPLCFYVYISLFSMPIQDFLFPRSLQSNYSSHSTRPHPSPPVDTGRPLFPPVRHLSFHSPVTTCPENDLKAMNPGKSNQMPPVNPSKVQALPSADGLRKLQLVEPLPGPGYKLYAALKNPVR